MISFGTTNRVILVGNIGREPLLKETEKNHKFVHLSIATNRRVPDGDDRWKDETTWHQATAWGKTAELCVKYLTKGSRVYLEGYLRSKTWKGADEKEHRTMDVTIDSISFLSKLKNSENGEPVSEMASTTPVSF
jgi:single-strand DNA-binding protein